MKKNCHDHDQEEYKNMGKDYIYIAKAIKKGLGETKFDRSVDKIRRQKAKGLLDYKFLRYIKPHFEPMVKEFVRILEDEKLDDAPNYRKILAYNTNFPDLFNVYGYEISSMLCSDRSLSPKRNKAFFDFPLFFKESCRRCGIARYAEMNIEDVRDILSEVVDLRFQESIQPRKDRTTIENETLVFMHRWENVDNPLVAKAERCSYQAMLEYTDNEEVKVVNKDFGSGYGFDLISYGPYGERLVTVKTPKEDGKFRLSGQEYITMVEQSKANKENYFIHSYMFDTESKIIGFTMYRYDIENDVLIDTSDISHIHSIERVVRERKGREIESYICKPIKIKNYKSYLIELTPDNND